MSSPKYPAVVLPKQVGIVTVPAYLAITNFFRMTSSHNGWDDGVWYYLFRFLNVSWWDVICNIPSFIWSLLSILYNIVLNLWILTFPIRYPLEVLSIFVAIGIIIHSVLAFFGHYVPEPNAKPKPKGKLFSHFRNNPIVWWAFWACITNYTIRFLLTPYLRPILTFLLSTIIEPYISVLFSHLTIPDLTFEPISLMRSIIDENPHLYWFIFLIIFKFTKILVHFRFNHTPSLQRSRTPHQNDIYKPSDVTVVIPTISRWGPDLEKAVTSMLANHVYQIIISTVGKRKQQNFQGKIARFLDARGGMGEEENRDRVVVTRIDGTDGDKRKQLREGYSGCRTRILAYADDHVIWPDTYVLSALSEFQDPRVGLVGTAKRVIREREPWAWEAAVVSNNICNFLASIYLERHNYELNATYNADGGVFVISGRTAFVRTQIFRNNPRFEWAFEGERWLGGKWAWPVGERVGSDGPMKVDDDNFITRWMVDHGWKTVFHTRIPEGLMDNTLGVEGGWRKFGGQLMRWARSTIRSNTTSLWMDGTCWDVYPWTTFAMFISCFFNIALVYEGMMLYCLKESGYGDGITYTALVMLLLGSKFLKPWNHYKAYPEDLVLCIPQILFGYLHGLIRMYAIFTASNVAWTGRKTDNIHHC